MGQKILQDRVPEAGISGISNCMAYDTVGCNYLSLSEIPARGAKVLITAKYVMEINNSHIETWHIFGE